MYFCVYGVRRSWLRSIKTVLTVKSGTAEQGVSRTIPGKMGQEEYSWVPSRPVPQDRKRPKGKDEKEEVEEEN